MYTFVTPYKPDDHTLFHRLAVLYKWPQADLRCKSTEKYGFFFIANRETFPYPSRKCFLVQIFGPKLSSKQIWKLCHAMFHKPTKILRQARDPVIGIEVYVPVMLKIVQ